MNYTNKELKIIDDAKRLCMERDSWTCRHCGTSEGLVAKQLSEKHGIVGWKLSNLIALCAQCFDDAKNIGDQSNNKVGVLLAGGKGSRLAPLTKFQNKHTLSIGKLPMVLYPIKTLRSLGVKKVMIVVDRENTGAMLEILGSGKEFGMDFTYKIQEGAGGISEALYLAKDFAQPGDQIYCILGDNIFDDKEVSDNFCLGDNSKACVFVKKVNNPQDYGVAILDANRVVSIVEKPKSFLSDLAVVGLYIYRYDVFSVIENIKPSARGELEISDVNDFYASRGELDFIKVNGYWADCGGSIHKYCEASLHGAKKANVSAEEIDNFKSMVFDEK